MLHRPSSSTSLPLYSCGSDNFWATCWDDDGWDDDNRCSVVLDISDNFSQANRCIDVRMTNVNDEGHDESDRADSQARDPDDTTRRETEASSPSPSMISLLEAPQTNTKGRAADRVAHSVRFSEIEYKSPEPPLTDEERALYFWTEAESRRLKLERRKLLTRYKRKLHFSGTAFWNDVDDSVRGLEDYTAHFCSLPSSSVVRREHVRRVLQEFHEQRLRTGQHDEDRLREVSNQSSRKSNMRALARGHEDWLAAQSFDYYQCPIDNPLLWDPEQDFFDSESF